MNRKSSENKISLPAHRTIKSWIKHLGSETRHLKKLDEDLTESSIEETSRAAKSNKYIKARLQQPSSTPQTSLYNNKQLELVSETLRETTNTGILSANSYQESQTSENPFFPKIRRINLIFSNQTMSNSNPDHRTPTQLRRLQKRAKQEKYKSIN